MNTQKEYDTQVCVAVKQNPIGFVDVLNEGAKEAGAFEPLLHEAACVIANLLLTDELREHRMTAHEYQKLAMRTCNIPYDQKHDMMMHAVLALTSEAGEVSGIFQKKYQGHTVDLEHLKEELGDCLWTIAEACTALDLSMEDVMQYNIDKLKKRYPDGFDPERSIHREEENTLEG